MSKSVKYLHLFLSSTLVHNKSIVEMINEPSFDFDRDSHRLVMKDQSNYEALKHYSNVEYEPEITSASMKVLKEASKECDYIFLHCNDLTFLELAKLGRSVLKKIIWCIWGHDLYCLWQPLSQVDGLYLKSKRFLANLYIRSRYEARKIFNRQMLGVGVGFEYDAVEVRKAFGDKIAIYGLPYGYIPGKFAEISKVRQAMEEEKSKKTNEHLEEPVRIMLGHSAFKFLNHLQLLDALSAYKDENICISLPLTYGDMKYGDQVASYAKEIFGEKVQIIRDHMTYKDYLLYLSRIDLCILDYKHQSALGNIWRLLFFNKKLFLNREGVIKSALNLAGVESYNTDEIEAMSYEEFVAPVVRSLNNQRLSDYNMNEDRAVLMWKNTLRELQ